MDIQRRQPKDERLARSCEAAADWLHHSEVVEGVEWLEARLHRFAYRKHRHDTYTIGVTDTGIQEFTYRGSSRTNPPGNAFMLYPDEPHDGHAATGEGLLYRALYVDPGLISEAVGALTGRGRNLPFVRDPVGKNPDLVATIRGAFQVSQEPLAIDGLVMRLAVGLLAADTLHPPAQPGKVLDLVAVGRAREFLEAESNRVVRSWELEAVTGLNRYELARQFRASLGTSPYRYLLMRRLGAARAALARQRPLVDVALETGFSDQAHFTRMFSGAFGISPGRFRQLSAGHGTGSVAART